MSMDDAAMWEFYSRPENQMPTGPGIRRKTPTRRPQGTVGIWLAWVHTNAPIVTETSNEARIIWRDR